MPATTPTVRSYINRLPLPQELKSLCSRVVEIARQSPLWFNDQWLSKHYSEAAMRVTCEKEYRAECAADRSRVHMDSPRHLRRQLLAAGYSVEEVKRLNAEEARLRGRRLVGATPMIKPFVDPVDTVIDESNMHIVWKHEDEQTLKSCRKLREARKAKLGGDHHPESLMWRISRAMRDAADRPFPRPPHDVEYAQHFVILAAVAICKEPMEALGEFGVWEWASQFAPAPEGADEFEKWFEVDPEQAKAGPHPLYPSYLNHRTVGREEILFLVDLDGDYRVKDEWGDLAKFSEHLSMALATLDEEGMLPPSEPPAAAPASATAIERGTPPLTTPNDAPEDETTPALSPENEPWLTYTKSELDDAVGKYKEGLSVKFDELFNAIHGSNEELAKAAARAATEIFGRNAVGRALRVKSWSMVTYSEVWVQSIAIPLKLRPPEDTPPAPQKIGIAAAIERAAEAVDKSAYDPLVRKETVEMIQTSRLKQEVVDGILYQLESGQIDDDQAEEHVNLAKQQQEDDSGRRVLP